MLGKLHRDKSLCNTKALFSAPPTPSTPSPFFSFPLTALLTINKNCFCAHFGVLGGDQWVGVTDTCPVISIGGGGGQRGRGGSLA